MSGTTTTHDHANGKTNCVACATERRQETRDLMTTRLRYSENTRDLVKMYAYGVSDGSLAITSARVERAVWNALERAGFTHGVVPVTNLISACSHDTIDALLGR